MINITRTTLLCLLAASVSVAATTKAQKRLTPARIAELSAPVEVKPDQSFKVAISDLGSVSLSAANPKGLLEDIRELRFPTEFDPPEAEAGYEAITPTTPTAFETINTGWTVNLTAKQKGRLVEIIGAADYVEATLLNSGYGAVAGPIHSEKGGVITPNVLHQPKIQTTRTHFHIFAVAGEPYEVAFYQGEKTVKHRVTVTAE